MKFTNEVLQKMEEKKIKYNSQYSKWYYGFSEELRNIESVTAERFKKKSDKINDCLNLWSWDAYHLNKKLHLQKVNRCMNNRFCPNCRKWDLAVAIHNFKKPFNDLLNKGYYPYLVTLTVPNVSGEDLKDTIDRMNKAFRKFFNALNYELVGTTRKGFSERLIQFDGALKVLEITVRTDDDGKVIDFHPHFHCIFFSTEYDESLFDKNILGAWSNKRNEYNYNSHMDIHLMKLWKMCYDNIRLSAKNFDNMSDDWWDLYLCDIRELDDNGIYEVMKYTFKDTDIVNYYAFKTFVISLEKKRIRQGYGVLYGLKLENETEGEKQDLELEIDEKPEQLLTRAIKELITVYHSYEKISTHKCMEELKNLD